MRDTYVVIEKVNKNMSNNFVKMDELLLPVIKDMGEIGINYIMLDNLSIYNSVKDINMVSGCILISDESEKRFNEYIGKYGRKVFHPYSVLDNWSYLYDLKPFELWYLEGLNKEYLNVVNRLCCKSITPKTWLPLDNLMQDYCWKTKIIDNNLGIFIPNETLQYVLLILNCVFDKKMFVDADIKRIEAVEPMVDKKMAKAFFEVEFFSFSSRLMTLLEEKKYTDIRKLYVSFSDY